MAVRVAVSFDEAARAAAIEERSTALAGFGANLQIAASWAHLSSSRRFEKLTTISVEVKKEYVRFPEVNGEVQK